MSNALRPDPLVLLDPNEPAATNAGDGGLYFNGDIPRSRVTEFAAPGPGWDAAPRRTGSDGFLNSSQFELLEILADLIIPTDYHSPGARAADVPAWLDRLIAASPLTDQDRWRDGLGAIEALASVTHTRTFVSLNEGQQIALLASLAVNESTPTTDEERFFRFLKQAVWDAYYRTEIGIHLDLEFRGNGFNKAILRIGES